MELFHFQYHMDIHAVKYLEVNKKMIKIGDTFKADSNDWVVTDYSDDSLFITFSRYIINMDLLDKDIRVYETNSHGRLVAIAWVFSFDEMRMCIEIIDKLKGEVK